MFGLMAEKNVLVSFRPSEKKRNEIQPPHCCRLLFFLLYIVNGERRSVLSNDNCLRAFSFCANSGLFSVRRFCGVFTRFGKTIPAKKKYFFNSFWHYFDTNADWFSSSFSTNFPFGFFSSFSMFGIIFNSRRWLLCSSFVCIKPNIATGEWLTWHISFGAI